MSKTILVYCGSSKGHNPIYEAEAKALMQGFGFEYVDQADVHKMFLQFKKINP